MACNGTVLPSTPIAVDFWNVRKCPSAKVFFLSHMHADHTVGLTPSWSGGTIYCSAVSKKLLIHKFKIKTLYIHELELNEAHLIPLDSEGLQTMSVHLFDANHCPGAVMFLFEGYFGRILYTGDFRYCPSMFLETPLSCSPEIDVLYLDNTYCTPKSVFPTREEAKQKIVHTIQKSLPRDVVIGVRNLGKERLLEDLALEFKTRVIVSQQMYENLEILEAKDVFSTNPEEGFIFAVPFNKINAKYLQDFNPRNTERSVVMNNADGQWIVVKNTCVIAILPTSLYIGLDGAPHCNCPNIYVVPYSDHSSYRELHQFVKGVKPNTVLPIVSGSQKGVFHSSLKDRADMSCFRPYLSGRVSVPYDIPSSVKQYMSTGPNSDQAGVSYGQKRKPKSLPVKPLCARKKSTAKMIEYSDSPDKSKSITPECTDTVTPPEGKRELVEITSSSGDTCTLSVDIADSPRKTQNLKCIEGADELLDVKERAKDEQCFSNATESEKVVSSSSTQCDEINVCTKGKTRKLPLTFKRSKGPKTIKSFFISYQSNKERGDSDKNGRKGTDDKMSATTGSEMETYCSLATHRYSYGGESKRVISHDLMGSSHSKCAELRQKPCKGLVAGKSRTKYPLVEISENSNSSDSGKSQVQMSQRTQRDLDIRPSKYSEEVIVIDDSGDETENSDGLPAGNISTKLKETIEKQHSAGVPNMEVSLTAVDSVMAVIEQEVQHRLYQRTQDNSLAQTRHKTKFCVKKRQKSCAKTF